jgi:CubicO group peptidase (beta-lactamase class C family)
MDAENWDAWLAELLRAHDIPGASLAVLHEDEVSTATAGVTNLDTQVDVTPDTLFQIGSIAKAYTATAVMRLAERGELGLDAPVRDLLTGFKVADPVVTHRVTPRHLLSHTSGIAGECFEDTGRGDDALERYVAHCAQLGQDLPLGRTMSYCNTGYSILGRMIERVTGKVWDEAMRELLLDPLELAHTTILPEEALRYRVAWGHVSPEPGAPPQPAPRWDDARSLAPMGGIAATATDVVRFARMHLDGRLLSPASIEEMQRVQVDVPERWATGDHWGLGWILHDWDGRRLFGHDGNMTGQSSHLVIDPTAKVAIALLANVSNSHELALDVLGRLLRETCGIERPPWPEPAEGAVESSVVGRYERYGIRLDIARRNGGLEATASVIEPLLSQEPEDPEPVTFPLKRSTGGPDVYVAQVPGTQMWMPAVFFEIDGERYVHMGARAQRRVG